MKWSGLCGSELVNLHESVHGFISWEVGTLRPTINCEEENIWKGVNWRRQGFAFDSMVFSPVEVQADED